MAINVSLDITDHSAEVLQAMREQVQLGLSAIGEEAEGYAKDDCPVDTGRLRNSIAFATATDTDGHDEDSEPQGARDEDSVYIGTNVEYAVYVEEGDYNHKTGKKHFLRDAVANHGDHYRDIMEAALNT